MMAVLGIGSGVALLSTVNTILLDAFPRVPTIYMSAISCSAGFLIGLVYVTPVSRSSQVAKINKPVTDSYYLSLIKKKPETLVFKRKNIATPSLRVIKPRINMGTMSCDTTYLRLIYYFVKMSSVVRRRPATSPGA